jgi:hypothetical protein
MVTPVRDAVGDGGRGDTNVVEAAEVHGIIPKWRKALSIEARFSEGQG